MAAACDGYAASGAIHTRVAATSAATERVPRAFPSLRQTRLDGLTLEAQDWWCNLRPSNTEPLLRLNLEARTAAECEARTAEVLAIVREA